jgi:hypothetical protein
LYNTYVCKYVVYYKYIESQIDQWLSRNRTYEFCSNFQMDMHLKCGD